MKLQDLPVKGKRVLVRVDFNVPFNKDGSISDDTRIQASLPTIRYLLDHGAIPILMSHLGRPKGAKVATLSLKPCAIHLQKLLGKEVIMAPDTIGPEVENRVSLLKQGQILVLENVRFYKGEEHPEQDLDFAKQLAKLGDFYVNDAFGTSHRAHSSTTTIAQYFPGKATPGFLLEKEIDFLGKHLIAPNRPFYAVIGGAKVSSKLGVLKSLLEKVDAFFIGGGMAYTFFKASGISIGDSLCEDTLIEKAKEFLSLAKTKKIPVYFPIDFAVIKDFDNNSEKRVVDASDGIPEGWQGVDIGPKTQEDWKKRLQNAKTVFWNGPLGVFEMSNFAQGTTSMAKTLADLKAVTIVGGGDSVAAINQLGLAEKFSHISTGGGAALEYIEYGHLPGIDALIK